MTDKSAAAVREFCDRWSQEWNENTGWYKSQMMYDKILPDLTALISEHYYPKEFVMWKDKKDLRYSSLHNRYYSDTDNGMREFTLDELFNYWEENEQEEEHPTNKEKFDGNYLPDPE